MQITIKKVTDNGNALEGVTMNVSVKELTTMMDNGVHLFGSNEPKEPEGFPEEEVNWDECCLKHEPVKKEDLLKEEKKILCKTFAHKYSSDKFGVVKGYLISNDIPYEVKNSTTGTDYVDYILSATQLVELQGLLNASEIGSGSVII